MLRLAAALLLLTAMFVPAAQGEWPSFHNDARHTGFVPNSSYPVFTDVWWNNRTPDGAQVKASPVLKDNILITASLGSASAKPANAGLVRGLDAASGKELWRHAMAKPVESTPAISGERVFVVDTGGALKALNLHTGAVEHTATVGATYGHLTLNEGKLFVGTEAGEVKAYLTSTLTLLWAFKVSEVFQTLGALNENTGKYACSAPLSAQPVRGAPVVFQGKVFFGSMNHWIIAVDEQGTGDLKTQVKWVYKTGDVVLSTGAINTRANQDPRIVFGSYDGNVRSFLTTASGEGGNNCHGVMHTPSWTFEVPTIVDAQTQDEQVSKVHSSPAAAGDKIFFGANNGKMYGIRADNGQRIWETSAGNVLQPVTGSPAVANGIVVVGSEDKNVYWFNADNGTILKKFATQSAVDTGPAIEGDRAFVAARDGTLYMFGPKIPTQPDLIVQSISATASGLSIVVKNNGDAASANTTVRLFLGGTFLANVAVAAIEPGQSKTVTHAMQLPEGSSTVRALVDPDGQVVESNESNNELSRGVSPPATATEGDGGGDGGGGGFKIPGPGFALVFAMLALALLGARRRR